MFKPITLCNRRYTWAEESLSTWNLQRMKTTFSERYKTTISSGHLHLKHRNPKILTLCLPHSKILRGAENTVTASKGLTINQESWEKHDKFRSCMRLSAKMQGVAVIHALGRGIFFKSERTISDLWLHQWTEIWWVPGWSTGLRANTGKGILGEKRRGWKKASRLQGYRPGRLTGPLTETPSSWRGSQLGVGEEDDRF